MPPAQARVQSQYLPYYKEVLGIGQLSVPSTQRVPEHMQISAKQLDCVLRVSRNAAAVLSRSARARPLSQGSPSDGELLRLNKTVKLAIDSFSRTNQEDDCYRSSKSSLPKKMQARALSPDDRCSLSSPSEVPALDIPELQASSVTKPRADAFVKTAKSNESNDWTSKGSLVRALSRTAYG